MRREEGPSGVSILKQSSGQHSALESHANLPVGKRSQICIRYSMLSLYDFNRLDGQ